MASDQVNKFDLRIRTSAFGKQALLLCNGIRETSITRPLISQLVRSSTSIGANYMEASCASSRKDFRNKIYIAKKEIQETKHWLNMLTDFVSDHETLTRIDKECTELLLIFQAITTKLDQSKSPT